MPYSLVHENNNLRTLSGERQVQYFKTKEIVHKKITKTLKKKDSFQGGFQIFKGSVRIIMKHNDIKPRKIIINVIVFINCTLFSYTEAYDTILIKIWHQLQKLEIIKISFLQIPSNQGSLISLPDMV